jgi:tetratricopeptide (TPR) repeat protein
LTADPPRTLNFVAHAADVAYLQARYSAAIPLFEEAARIAHAAGDPGAFTYEFFLASSLLNSGKYREALPLMLQLAGASGDVNVRPNLETQGVIFNAYTSCLEIGQALPMPLNAIEKFESAAQAYAHDAGHPEWRHKILNLRCRRLTTMGRFAPALAAGEEAWSVRQRAPLGIPGFWEDIYMDAIVMACLWLRDAEAAERWLEAWQTQENRSPESRDVRCNVTRSVLARLKGDPATAFSFARHAYAQDIASTGLRSAAAMLRAALVADEVATARDALGRILAARHSQSLFDRFAVRELQAIYWMAHARLDAGLEPVDESFDDVPIPAVPENRLAGRRAFTHLRWAGLHAAEIDRLLGTTFAGDRVSMLQRRLDAPAA